MHRMRLLSLFCNVNHRGGAKAKRATLSAKVNLSGGVRPKQWPRRKGLTECVFVCVALRRPGFSAGKYPWNSGVEALGDSDGFGW